MAKRDLTAARAIELFDYDHVTGVLTRRPCPLTRWLPHPITRSCDPRGYLKTCADNKSYFVHRIIWLMAHGNWPVHQIDHINRNPADNRLENLRDVPCKVNLQNRTLPEPKPKRIKPKKPFGWVEFDPGSKKYRARYRANRQRINLGSYASPEAARVALAARKQCMGTLNVEPNGIQQPG